MLPKVPARRQLEAGVSSGGLAPSRRDFIRLAGKSGIALMVGSPAQRLFCAEPSFEVMFTDVTASAGLARALNVCGNSTDKQLLLEEMGCGVALFDYDNDGWLDIFLVNGTTLQPPSSGRGPTSYLFRNNHDGTFTDVTAEAGLTHSGWGKPAAWETMTTTDSMTCL